MPFVEPVTIREAIQSIDKKNYVLPAIQREFIWSTYQIERLFDSLMRDYPISSFLFWEVEKENIGKYQFYEFLRDYHERDNRHNPKANLKGEKEIIAVLDGQQRLTSLYIGLKGTYAYRLPRKRWDNDSAFPKRRLCINLISPAANGDLEFDFQFLTESEYKKKDESYSWFVLGDILNIKEPVEVNDYLLENGFSSLDKDKFRFANKTLYKLYEVIHKNKSINFFLEKGESLDKVLNIFIRVNSGGTQLSYSDLLLSIATAQWKEKDARETITKFVDDINVIGGGFDFNKDYVLKSCLVLSDFKDIAFKVDNFNQDNMLYIEKHWEKISASVKQAITLISSFGYSRDTLTSNNAIIPIAYYLYLLGSPPSFIESSRYLADRKIIFKWLIAALLKRTFSGQPDNVLRPIREVIRRSPDVFPHVAIIAKLKGTPKSMVFDDDEIGNLLFYQYGQSYTYSVLSLLYPTLDFKNKFHQDHIFPKTMFTTHKLLKRGYESERIDFYLENYNYIANLQLLEGIPNQEKSAADFKSWILKTFPNETERKEYMRKHYIPEVELDFDNFEQFIVERKKLLTSKIKELIS